MSTSSLFFNSSCCLSNSNFLRMFSCSIRLLSSISFEISNFSFSIFNRWMSRSSCIFLFSYSIFLRCCKFCICICSSSICFVIIFCCISISLSLRSLSSSSCSALYCGSCYYNSLPPVCCSNPPYCPNCMLLF